MVLALELAASTTPLWSQGVCKALEPYVDRDDRVLSFLIKTGSQPDFSPDICTKNIRLSVVLIWEQSKILGTNSGGSYV